MLSKSGQRKQLKFYYTPLKLVFIIKSCISSLYCYTKAVFGNWESTLVCSFDYNHTKRLNYALYKSLFFTTQMMEKVSDELYSNQYYWAGPLMGHSTSLYSPSNPPWLNLVTYCRSWLESNDQKAQVMIASVLLVIGVWWLVRTILTLVINLICPLIVVLLAVVFVPQLRISLLGQNYPLVANLLKNFLLKLAESIKTE